MIKALQSYYQVIKHMDHLGQGIIAFNTVFAFHAIMTLDWSQLGLCCLAIAYVHYVAEQSHMIKTYENHQHWLHNHIVIRERRIQALLKEIDTLKREYGKKDFCIVKPKRKKNDD